MINIKKHAKQRYIERILGITDTQDIKVALVDMDERIIDHVNKMFEHASFIYKGQIGDNTTKNFYLVDNIVLVTDVGNTCVITLYKCSFGFGDSTDRFIIKSEIEQITALHEELNKIEVDIGEFVEAKQTEISTIDAKIRATEEQIKQLRTMKSAAEGEIEAKRATRTFNMKEIENRAVRICNSIEYRRDLKESVS